MSTLNNILLLVIFGGSCFIAGMFVGARALERGLKEEFDRQRKTNGGAK